MKRVEQEEPGQSKGRASPLLGTKGTGGTRCTRVGRQTEQIRGGINIYGMGIFERGRRAWQTRP